MRYDGFNILQMALEIKQKKYIVRQMLKGECKREWWLNVIYS